MPFGRRRNRIERSLRERGVPPEPQHREREVEETSGPWDSADAPDDGVQRIDLGSIRLPGLPGTDLRVELNPQQKVVGATLRAGDSLLQVAAFAAPRADGIWDSVRDGPADERVRPGRVAARGRGPLRPRARRHDPGPAAGAAGAGDRAAAGPPRGAVPRRRRSALVPARHDDRPGRRGR